MGRANQYKPDRRTIRELCEATPEEPGEFAGKVAVFVCGLLMALLYAAAALGAADRPNIASWKRWLISPGYGVGTWAANLQFPRHFLDGMGTFLAIGIFINVIYLCLAVWAFGSAYAWLFLRVARNRT
jgi:hypothetical protein